MRARPLVVLALFASARVARADGPPATATEQDEDYAQSVTVRGNTWPSPRGVGDMRIKRDLIEASPRQQTSEMLSAAPGFFVDHEDAEGLGNDIHLRGFDLSHGSGVEMRLGAIPLNAPVHVRGQGYVDANFIIPEVVRSIRVLEGPYDPRQGDAAIVGSAYFDVGVAERGYQMKGTYGSFGQGRAVGIVAPTGMDEETFTAFAFRRSGGFGANRGSTSGSAMAQYAANLGANDRLKVVATSYLATSLLAGVVRRDDVDAGRIGFYEAYPTLAGGQGATSTRAIVGVDYDHSGRFGHLEVVPWVSLTRFRSRQNYTGNLEAGAENPTVYGLGDLHELENQEAAVGVTARLRSRPIALGSSAELVLEPGVYTRAGASAQQKGLLRTPDLGTWDHRLDVGVKHLDAGTWVDVDLRLAKRLRLSGGPRVDLLSMSVDDRLTRTTRGLTGVAFGPRATLTYDAWRTLSPAISYGEGFRSLNPDRLRQGNRPYSKVRSGEIGVRMATRQDDFVATVALFETHVENELVFEAEAGGLETEKASVRRGLVTSLLGRPRRWLLVSSALSITRSEFTTLVPGISHLVPQIPSVLFRTDVTARGEIGRLARQAVVGRVGLGTTLLGGRHLSDAVIGAVQTYLNASVGLRRGMVEVGVDGFNLLGLEIADDEAIYASNWTTAPLGRSRQAAASIGRHLTAAPPLTVLASLTLYL